MLHVEHNLLNFKYYYAPRGAFDNTLIIYPKVPESQ